MESLSDIEEELRDLSRSAEYCDLQPPVNGMTISAYFANLADRIAAIDSADAWRSLYTPGNAAAMREALVSVHALIADEPDGTPMIDAMKATIEAALSAPPRNCDVGTPEEQAKRWEVYCNERHCEECPWFHAESCEFAWAQMPYKEGARK